jgi:ElaB/YqjD/DUF883 family membrane-anchored ribosome-binding protein
MNAEETQRFEDRARELEAQFGPQLEQARQNLTDLNRRVTNFVRENPGTCLLGALAFGFVVGKLASRR